MFGSLKILLNDDIFKDKNFEVQFCRCSYEKCLGNKLPEGGNRIYYSLHFVVNGRGFLEQDGKKVALGKNDIFVVYPGENVKYYPDQKNPWSYIWVNLMGNGLEELFTMCACGPQMSHNSLCNSAPDGEFAEMFRKLLDTYNTFTSSTLECCVMFLKIVSKLIKLNEADQVGKPAGTGSKNLVREAIIFMSNNYRLNISLSDVATGIGVSNSYLVELFAKEKQISPMKFLTLYRIAAASELLASGKMNVSEVSREVGFNDPLYFSRCFSAVKGCSPREYMKSPDADPWLIIKEKNVDYR